MGANECVLGWPSNLLDDEVRKPGNVERVVAT